MSRCPYCRRQLPGFETLCQQCFEAGYDRVTHPRPWWQRFHLTSRSLYTFFFGFVYGCLTFSINRDHPLTTTSLASLALLLAAFITIIASAMSDGGEPWLTRRTLFGFLILSIFFFVRFWIYSSYHPFPHPILSAFVIATVAALMTGFGDNPGKTSAP
jgi:hypothetical protein